MASSSNSKNHYHVRSISLPCRSHPSMVMIEEKLNEIKTSEASASPNVETISNAVSGLEDLYMCMDDLLKLTLTQQILSLHQHEEFIDGLLDGSLRLIDVCGIVRDYMSQIKGHVRDLQSALRRRKGDLSIETSIAKYICFRKKMKKDAKKLMAEVKQIDKRIGACSQLLGLDHHFSSVVRVLREVVVASTSIFHSILLFLSTSTLNPPATRSLVSRLLHKGTVACEFHNVSGNKLQSVDFALNTLRKWGSSEGERKQIARNSLELLETSIGAVENGLECLFRSMIRARASLKCSLTIMRSRQIPSSSSSGIGILVLHWI